MCYSCGNEIVKKHVVTWPGGYAEYCSMKCAKKAIIDDIEQLIDIDD